MHFYLAYNLIGQFCQNVELNTYPEQIREKLGKSKGANFVIKTGIFEVNFDPEKQKCQKFR